MSKRQHQKNQHRQLVTSYTTHNKTHTYVPKLHSWQVKSVRRQEERQKDMTDSGIIQHSITQHNDRNELTGLLYLYIVCCDNHTNF